jgi:hypothetical protein
MSAPTTLIPRLLPAAEVAERLWLSTRKIVALARAGKIDHIVIDAQIFFTEEDVAAFIRAHRVEAEVRG